MSEGSSSEHKRALRVNLSHPDVGHVGDGRLTFGYGCTCTFTPDGLAPKVRLTEQQLAEGLVAEAEDGKKWRLFGCKGWGHSLFIDFVAQVDLPAGKVHKFEVRYSDVSDWFSTQMRLKGEPGGAIEWESMPATLTAKVAQPGLNFECESYYVGTLVRHGENRNLHQHFEFQFTATLDRFTLTEVSDLARRFSHLLSLLLGHPCSIVSVDVSHDGVHGGRMYYGVSESPPPAQQSTDDPGLLAWRNFFTSKDDVEGHWDSIVKRFFRSKHRDVVWARLAGMQNFKGFWEYRVLGYVTLLDGFVSKDFKSTTPLPPSDKLLELATALATVKPKLTMKQEAAVLDAAAQTFSSMTSFAAKFNALMASLDADVVKVINFTSADFKRIKKLRDQIAHASPLSHKGSDLTPLIAIMNRLTLLLMYLFFLEVGLDKYVFLRCLDRPRNQLRMASNIDAVHLHRVLRPDTFFAVTPKQLEVILKRPPRLFTPCFVIDRRGRITYSLEYSRRLQKAIDGTLRHAHERLKLPKEAVRYVALAYFEEGAHIEAVHSVTIIDRSKSPA